MNLNKKKKFERPSRIMISIPISDCSFDETSMDSCPLAAIGDETRGNDLSKDGNEVEVTSLEEAKSVIAALRARQRAQAHQMLAWRRTLKLQVRRKIKAPSFLSTKIYFRKFSFNAIPNTVSIDRFIHFEE